jgi:uncharacterized membrane protein YqjE
MSESAPKASQPGPMQRLASSFLGLLHSHLGLFSIELEEARDNLIKTLVLAIVGAGAILLGLLTLMLTIILMVDPEQRLFAAIGMLAFFLLLGGICLGMARHVSKHGVPPFPQTMDELRRDRERLLP